MKRKTKLLLAALAVCLLAAVIAAASLTLAAADEKNGTFNGSPAAVDEEGNLLLNSTNFPHWEFLSYVSDFDTDGDGALSVAEAAEVTEIDIHTLYNNIDPSGICYFTSLTYLDCSGNQIEELDVSKCTKLTHLKCRRTMITELDVSQCTELTYLDCGSNDIAELDVSQCTELTYLGCGSNDIAELDVSQCTELTYLDCGSNDISELDVSKCTELKYLDCGSNDIAELDVSKCTELTYLDCGSNDIAELDVSKCTKLEYLEFRNTDIAELDISKCSELTELDYTNNNIADLDISKCTKLSRIFCSNNNIVKLDVSNCTGLTYLDCSNNDISELDVGNCTELTELYCSNNNIVELDVSNCTKLTDLECENNNITELDVSKCTKLKSLECENNRITEIDLSASPDINTAMLGQYVNISDIKMNENAEPKHMSFGVNSYFDKDENVYKVDYAEYLEYINSIAKKWNAEGIIEPFKSTKGEFEEKFSDGSSRKTSWYDNWYIDSNDDENDNYRPDDGRTYYWPSYKDGAFVGISLDEHPELADYYKKSPSLIAYDIEGTSFSSDGWAWEDTLFELTLYVTPEPTLTDSDADVTVEYPKNEREDYTGVSLNAEGLTEGSEYDAAEKALGSEYTDIVPYSLTLTDKDGKRVSVKSKLTVNIPVPEGWEAGKTLVFYIDGEGNAVDMNAAPTEDGKFVTFETTHFSTYALVNAATKTETPPAETDPVETDPAETDPAVTEPETTPVETEPETTPAVTTPDKEGGKGESEPPQTGDFGAAIIPVVVAVSVLGIGITAVSIKSRAGRK